MPSPVRDVADWASMSCQAPPQQNPVVNTLYQFNNIQLSQFPRAIQVAQAYQMFRIKKATFRFKPTYDTFTANGGNSKLNLYYIIDKTGSLLPNASLSAIKQMGAKAFQLDEEPIEVSCPWRVGYSDVNRWRSTSPRRLTIHRWLALAVH